MILDFGRTKREVGSAKSESLPRSLYRGRNRYPNRRQKPTLPPSGFRLQDTGKKGKILNEAIDAKSKLERIFETSLLNEYRDGQTGHCSKTKYRMIAGRKL